MLVLNSWLCPPIAGPGFVVQATDDFDSGLGANWSQRNAASNSIVAANDGEGRFGFNATAAVSVNEALAAWVGAGTPTNDHMSEVAIFYLVALTDSALGAAVRVSSDTNGSRDCYFAYVSLATAGPSRTTVLGKVVNGTRTVLNSAAVTWGDGDLLGISAVGTTLTVYQNGVALGGSFTATDADLSTGTWGIVANGNASLADNWSGYSYV